MPSAELALLPWPEKRAAMAFAASMLAWTLSGTGGPLPIPTGGPLPIPPSRGGPGGGWAGAGAPPACAVNLQWRVLGFRVYRI